MRNGSHSRHSYPADKPLPVGVTHPKVKRTLRDELRAIGFERVLRVPPGVRRGLKALHTKKSRQYGKAQAREELTA